MNYKYLLIVIALPIFFALSAPSVSATVAVPISVRTCVNLNVFSQKTIDTVSARAAALEESRATRLKPT